MRYGTEQIGDGPETRQTAPTVCANGHALRPPNVQAYFGVHPERVERMSGWRCWECGSITWQDGSSTEEPTRQR